jgi:hypothetical protein
MRRILRYLFSATAFLLLILPCPAQENRIKGPRIGYDAGGLALLYFEPERRVHTFSLDYEIKTHIYPALELGWQNVEIDRQQYHYLSDGKFARIGVDINLIRDENPDNYDMGFAGVRYGISAMNHSVNNIVIEEAYWGDITNQAIVENRLMVHWLSAGGGLRAELFPNFFIGWSLYANIKLAQTGDANMDPYNIPGFGSGARRLALTINYSLFYRIPLMR